MLLYAASPLFNGNSEYYSDFKNKDGEQLISLQYDKEKWKKALDAAEDAINEAHAAGHDLYTHLQAPVGISDAEKGYFNHRWSLVTMPSAGNTDIIWAYTGSRMNIQQMIAPRGLSQGSTTVPYGGLAPSMQMVETYLTKNGLPIDKDPSFQYDRRFGITTDPETGEKTVRLHLDRATNFELDGRDGIKGGKGYTLYLRMGEINPETNQTNGNDPLKDNITPNGYLWKKYLHPNTSFANNQVAVRATAFPLVRLTELYLNYVEAYYEYYGRLDGQALIYLNDIRSHAGIPDVETSWQGIAGKDYREIIRQERTIELMYEGHRFFDARRWKIAHLTFNKVQKRWNCFPAGFTTQSPQSAENYLTLRNSNEPTKTFNVPQHYLYPLDSRDININPNLVQNPGW